MESLETSEEFGMSEEFAVAPSDNTRTIILGEIVGATNLVAALRESHRGGGGERDTFGDEASTSTSSPRKSDRVVNSFCNVYWGDTLIHQTKTISKNNNPIWACDTGSLFKIEVSKNISIQDNLRIEVYDKIKRRGKKKKINLIGVVNIPARKLGSLCDEKRNQFVIHNDRQSAIRASSRDYVPNGAFINMPGLKWDSMIESLQEWMHDDDDSDSDDDGSIHSDDSIYGDCDSVVTFQPERDIDDDFIFGKSGTMALRFRIATKDDLNFLNAIDAYHMGLAYAKKTGKKAFQSMMQVLDGSIMANYLVSDKTTADCDVFSSYWIHGLLVDTGGVKRLRVKPGPDPSRPDTETKFLSEAEMVQECGKPSHNWVEAGSGSLGQIKVEILSCQGLTNKDLGKIIGRRTDAFACVIYEDCIVETDVIMDCLNPMWMPWSQRAFMFNRTNALSSLYVGVFNHEHGPFKHNGCGRIAIDLNKFEPNTVYTLKYNLYNSPLMSTRKAKGIITVRLEITDYCQKNTLLSIPKPPLVHINIKKKKTSSIAKYTCYGKYREDVYNTKVLMSYIDEIMEYIELGSFEVTSGIQSLILWRAQVYIWRLGIPLHSLLAFVSATYVVERPHLVPSYLCFCLAWFMLVNMNRRKNHPCPWYQSRAFRDYLKLFLPFYESIEPKGVTIEPGEGFEEKERMEARRKQQMEDDKLLQAKIAKVREELNEILVSLSDSNLQTENQSAFNPLSKLLPVQLVLRDVIFYVRCVKSIVCCDDGRISFFVTATFIALGALFLVLPISSIIHWACRIVIWIFLGPWMKVVDLVLRRKNTTDKVNKTVQKVVKEIQEQEEKRFLEARMQREETWKMRAIRSLRFGRYAIRVPAANVTRHHDYPLPDSFSRPISEKEKKTRLQVKQYIPGQSTYGVMIPELVKPKKKILKEKLVRSKKLARLNESFATERKLKRKNVLKKGLGYIQSFKFNPLKTSAMDREEKELAMALQTFDFLGEEVKSENGIVKNRTYLNTKLPESFVTNRRQKQTLEEGFELITAKKRQKDSRCDDNQTYASEATRSTEKRDDLSFSNLDNDVPSLELFIEEVAPTYSTGEAKGEIHFLASPSQDYVPTLIERDMSDLSETDVTEKFHACNNDKGEVEDYGSNYDNGYIDFGYLSPEGDGAGNHVHKNFHKMCHCSYDT